MVLAEVFELLGPPAQAIAVTFAAYLVGTIVEFDPEQLWRYGGRPEWVTSAMHRTRVTRFLLELVRSPALSASSQKDIGRMTVATTADRREELASVLRVLTEIRQLATRLQATHPDLYDKYDRLLAEARFRFNICFPLSVFVFLAAWRLSGTASVLVMTAGAVVVSGVVLMRQVAVRVARANDVIAQAFITGLIEASPHAEASANQTEAKPSRQDETDAVRSGPPSETPA